MTASVFSSNKKPKVIVIGAGLSGLTTAYRLQQEGIDVEVYEARNRVGGRVLTINIDGNSAELGGQNITDGGHSSLFSTDTIVDIYQKYGSTLIKMGFYDICQPVIVPVFAEDRTFSSYGGAVGYSWPSVPYVKGSYSYISLGQEILFTLIHEENGEKVKTLFAPIDQRLYFAGEHTSILLDVPGTMEAACESGERTARMILKAHY